LDCRKTKVAKARGRKRRGERRFRLSKRHISVSGTGNTTSGKGGGGGFCYKGEREIFNASKILLVLTENNWFRGKGKGLNRDTRERTSWGISRFQGGGGPPSQIS